MKTISIFLASSQDLSEDRNEFDFHTRKLNDTWIDNYDIRLKVVRSEYGIGALSKEGRKEEYKRILQDCDLYVMLYSMKVSETTDEEFDHAVKVFKENGRPLIYTYFRNESINISELDQSSISSYFGFQSKLESLDHARNEYKNITELNLHFLNQLDLLRSNGTLTDQAPLNKNELSSTIDAIKEELSRNQSIKLALQNHEAKLIAFSPSHETELILLKTNWTQFESEKRIGLLSYDQENQRRSQLTYRFLQILDSIQQSAS